MSVTSTIKSQWDDLSERAQQHIARTRANLLHRWDLYEEGECYRTITAETADEAIEIAKDNVDRSNYSDAEGTIWIDVLARNLVTGEEECATVQLDEDEPECSEGKGEHDWRRPYSVLGGLKENPGVWGNGGGVIIKECCAHCGMYRTTDTWAQRPDTGEQGLTSVSYEEADSDSIEWSQQKRDAALLQTLAQVADFQSTKPGHLVCSNLAPDSKDYGGETEPGSEWDDECERILARVRNLIPAGWEADWCDDDMVVEYVG